MAASLCRMPHAGVRARDEVQGMLSYPARMAANSFSAKKVLAKKVLANEVLADRVTAQAHWRGAATSLEYSAGLSGRRRCYAASARRTHRAPAEAAHSGARCAGGVRHAVP